MTKDGGTVTEQFAKSRHGRKVYHLQQDGLDLASSQREMTQFQENVYMTAKAYWSEREREEAESNTSVPNENPRKYR